MAGKRARAQKKRADYRKGGRVNLEGGGIPFDDPEYVRGGTATTGGAGYGQGASTGSTQKREIGRAHV